MAQLKAVCAVSDEDTSVHPAAAGVQIKLLKAFLKHGASVDGLSGGWKPLIAALHSGRGEASAFLA